MAAIFSFCDGDAAADGQQRQILAGDIGGDGQRHRLLGEARGFQLFLRRAQIVPRQTPEIELIAGVEGQAELLAVAGSAGSFRRCSRLARNRPGRRSGETGPRAGWWIAPRPASPAPRRWRYRDCRSAPRRPARSAADRQSPATRTARARLSPGRALPVTKDLGSICGARACGIGVEQPANRSRKDDGKTGGGLPGLGAHGRCVTHCFVSSRNMGPIHNAAHGSDWRVPRAWHGQRRWSRRWPVRPRPPPRNRAGSS